MIQINSLKLPCGHSKEELEEKICKQLKISRSHLKSWKILRQSIDARKKPEIFFVYLIEAEVDNERTIVKKLHNPSIVIASAKTSPCNHRNRTGRTFLWLSARAARISSYSFGAGL